MFNMNPEIVLDCVLHKLTSIRKSYRVTLLVPDNGIPIIEYKQTNSSKKPKKSIQLLDLLFADKKHDTNDKFAFSIYTIDKTVTFRAQDESQMNEWLSKIREYHSNLYPEFKRYDFIFEATLLDRGLAKTMTIQGPYRLALCKESLDLIPLIVPEKVVVVTPSNTTITPLSGINHHPLHHHLPHHLPNHQRFHKRHPLVSSKTIELMLRSIRRCGHTSNNFYIESGRHSQVGEGDLWMALTKKSTARQLHELLLATMKLASFADDIYKAPRSRSGSSSDHAHRAQQSRSSSLNCLDNNSSNTTNNNISTDEEGYLPMA